MKLSDVGRIWGFIIGRSPELTADSKFVDLAPTAEADGANIYFEALNFATNRDSVLNIALTGPYGSGKSSVIRSFLAQYPRPALQLSLAAFLPDGAAAEKRVSKEELANDKREIERSILQQILYGVEADKLPFSRFKRIRTPGRFSPFYSLLIALGLACAWYVFSRQADLVSGAFFDPFPPSNWFGYVLATFGAAFAWMVVHWAFTNSFGLSLKSISLKDMQIAPAAANEDSILNRHLDEILYFFQSTDYDLVVIEDLDRFEDPDIFVTLREINGLINASKGTGRRVRFLYALRDDIFKNTDRTKFFEFIIPIVPIINHSNSIDKVLEQGRRIDLDARLDRRFLREVSRYLTDLRLIRNIFNEYVVYAANVRADRDAPLDPNKMLALLIYKNVLPKDFAALHRQEGVLSRVLSRYEDYVAKIEADIRRQIEEMENDLAVGEAQALRDQSDLRKVYAMAIVARIPASTQFLHTSVGKIGLATLAESDALETIIAQKFVSVSGNYTSKDTIHFRDLEESVDPTRSYKERVAALDRKSTKFKADAGKRLKELKLELSSLRTRRFNEVVRGSSELIDQIFAEVADNRELLKYLILEGYLDDTYYQYTSLFHGGRLSPNDNNFLIQIRGYTNPPPDFPIDNVAEVIASMRAEDFRHRYVLNRFLVDHLLTHPSEHRERINDAVEYIASHFDECREFFRSYYAKGVRVRELTQAISPRWPDFASTALEGPDGATYAARVLAYAPDQALTAPSSARAFRAMLSVSLRSVAGEGIEFDFGRLRALNIQVSDVASLEDVPNLRSYVAQEGLYRISVDNISHIVKEVIGWRNVGDLETNHYSTLRKIGDSALLDRIDADFPSYISMLLSIEGNIAEDVAAISSIMGREDVDELIRAQFLERQTTSLPSLDCVPASFHRLMLEGQHAEPSWENCFQFMASETYDPDVLTSYLGDPETAASLSRQPIPSDETLAPLREFVITNDALDAEVYRSYVRQTSGTLIEFPDVDDSKLNILIEERKISFTPSTFASLDDENLQVLFVATNFPSYEAESEQYSIDDGFKAKLLHSRLSDAQKLRLVDAMNESSVVGSPTVAAHVGALLERSMIGDRTYGPDFIKAVISNSRPVTVQVSLLNKLQSGLTEADARAVIRQFPAPYGDIAIFGKSPRIDSTDANREFARWLKERRIVSSYAPTLLGDEIRIHTFKKGP